MWLNIVMQQFVICPMDVSNILIVVYNVQQSVLGAHNTPHISDVTKCTTKSYFHKCFVFLSRWMVRLNEPKIFCVLGYCNTSIFHRQSQSNAKTAIFAAL